MGQGSRNETRRGSRRERMRASARSLHLATPPTDEGFQTPAWLEKSFVLPLTPTEATDVPVQPVPHHDDDEESASVFVRPPAPEIDFALVVRRADLARRAFRTAIVATALAGLSVIGFLLTSWPPVLGAGIALAVVAVVACLVRLRVVTTSVPYVER